MKNVWKTPTWTVSVRLAILHDFAHHKALLLPVRAPTCVSLGTGGPLNHRKSLRGRGYPWNTEGAWKTKDLNGFFQDVDDLWMCRKRPIQRVWKVDKEGSSNSWWRPDPCTHLKDQVKWPSYSDAICSTCGMDFPLHASVATSPRIQEFEVILRNVCPSQKKQRNDPCSAVQGLPHFSCARQADKPSIDFPPPPPPESQLVWGLMLATVRWSTLWRWPPK